MSLGLAMGGSDAVASGQVSVNIPKQWIRQVCDDPLDELEYTGLQSEVLQLLRSVVEDRCGDWKFHNMMDSGDSHTLTFKR